MKKVILLFLLFFNTALCSFAQENPDIEMATGLRASGKIYVVVAVVVIIFAGFIAYLYSLDRKMSRLEKENKNQ